MGNARLAGLAVVLVAVLALPAAAAQESVAPLAAAEQGITVVGVSSVPTTPDVAEWGFGVQARSMSAPAALRTAGARARAVAAAIKAAGVAPEDIQTQHVSLYPRFDEEEEEVRGYAASSGVRVVIRNLSTVGRVIGAAVRAGASDVYGPNLTASNREQLYRQALTQAYDEAREKAEVLAAKTGLTLGRPVAVVEGSRESGYGNDGGGGALSDEGIEPGTTHIGASVTVTFAAS
jgi:uncharacterized protein